MRAGALDSGPLCRTDEGIPRNATIASAAPANPEESYGSSQVATEKKLGLKGSIPLGPGAALDVGLNLAEGITDSAGGKSGCCICPGRVN